VYPVAIAALCCRFENGPKQKLNSICAMTKRRRGVDMLAYQEDPSFFCDRSGAGSA
jgi:hypothetical protein